MRMWLLFVAIVASPAEPPRTITLEFGDKLAECTKMERAINASAASRGDARLFAWCYKGEKP